MGMGISRIAKFPSYFAKKLIFMQIAWNIFTRTKIYKKLTARKTFRLATAVLSVGWRRCTLQFGNRYTYKARATMKRKGKTAHGERAAEITGLSFFKITPLTRRIRCRKELECQHNHCYCLPTLGAAAGTFFGCGWRRRPAAMFRSRCTWQIKVLMTLTSKKKSPTCTGIIIKSYRAYTY